MLGPSKRSVRLNDLALRMDTTVWRLAHAAEVHWHSAGVEVHDVLLQSSTGGRVYANGMLPTEGNANLVLDIANFQVSDVATFMQWVNAYAQRQTELADFYHRRFRAEFKPAVAAWIATRRPIGSRCPMPAASR